MRSTVPDLRVRAAFAVKGGLNECDGSGLVGVNVPVGRGLAVAGLAAWTAAAGVVLTRRIRPAEVIR